MNKKIFTALFLIQFIVISFLLPADKLRYSVDLKPDLSRSAVISMVTVYPGNEVYSLFGHSSFRIFDPDNGIDWMFNYGTFDFDDPLFLPKFVKGQLDYYISVDDFQRAFRFYSVYEKRKVVEQVLNLDYEEKKTVFSFLMENALPENMYYKYDFIHDNCSTRIADVLIRCFGKSVRFPSGRGDSSFRTMIASYLTSYPFLAAGIEIVLGSPSDRIPSGTEKFFLPVPMIEGFDNAVLISSDGEKKLVSENKTIRWGGGSIQTVLPEAETGETSSANINYPFVIFLFLLILEIFSVMTAVFKIKKFSLLDKLTRLTELLFIFLSGICGLLIFYLWFLSDHIVPDWNFHLLWLSPVSLIYCVLLLFKRWRGISIKVSRILFVSAFAFFIIMLAGIQSLSFPLLPLYFFTLIVFFKRGAVCKKNLSINILRPFR